jgi:hypothetical protein
MARIFQIALVSAAVSFAAVALTTPANAGIGISINFGGVADGYTDGYWDTHHHWHAWRAGEWNAYRRAHPHHAHMWRHNDLHHH